MKILSSFDTKKDEKVLKEVLEEFGDEHAFMLKRHWLYLMWMFFYAILMFMILALLIYVLYQILDTVSFGIIVSLNLMWVWWWLILTFYQLYKYLKNYKFILKEISEKDLEDGILETYLKLSFFLFFFQIAVIILTTILAVYNNNWDMTNVFLNIIQVILSLWFLYFIRKIIYILINFEMDFVIIAPDHISTYNQSWIFKRESKTIWVDKIKSIQANKKGLIRSIFDFGEVIILTEGDEVGRGEIRLKFIPKPDTIRKKIVKIMNIE